jgi:hypothetical protein
MKDDLRVNQKDLKRPHAYECTISTTRDSFTQTLYAASSSGCKTQDAPICMSAISQVEQHDAGAITL